MLRLIEFNLFTNVAMSEFVGKKDGSLCVCKINDVPSSFLSITKVWC